MAPTLSAAELGTIPPGRRALADIADQRNRPDMLVLADRGFFLFDLWPTIWHRHRLCGG